MHISRILIYFICFLQVNIIAQNAEFQCKELNDSNLIFIEGGKFKFGDKNGETDEKPQRNIKIKSFYIGKYEVTNAEFVKFLNEKGNQIEGNSEWINLQGNWKNLKCRIYKNMETFFVEKGYEQFPVNFVNWYGANAYCKWKGGRLPTEAEWEYVAKGGKYYKKQESQDNIKNLEKYAWFFNNSDEKWHKKGQKKCNILGVFDITGNLWEWCNDYYSSEYYKKMENKNPTGPIKGDYRVIRGGSWTNKIDMMRISNRNAINPNSNKINCGFRIVYDFNTNN